MAGKLGRSEQQKTEINISGGLATRPTNQIIEKMSKGKVYLSETANIELYKIGALKKSTGFTVNANRPNASSVWLSQTTENVAVAYPVTTSFTAVCFKVTAPSNGNFNSLLLSWSITQNVESARVLIKADSAGSPGSTINTSSSVIVRQGTDESATWTFKPKFINNAPTTLTSGTDYWICLEVYLETRDGVAISGAGSFSVYCDSSLTTAANVKYTTNNYSSFTNIGSAGFPYYQLESTLQATTNEPIQGLYNVLSESGGTIGQDIVAFQGGGLYPMTTPSAPTTSGWDSVLTGASALGSGQNVLGDYKTLNNLHFFSDYSTNIQRVWDASANYTMQQGFRPTFSLAQSASAGGPWSAAGLVKLIGIVTMSSGGFRATAVGSITLAATTNKIDISSITNSVGAATDLGFDAGLLNMTWYATIPNGSIYYKVPAASISGGAGTNPNTNATNFSITPTTDAALQAGGTLDLNLGIPQSAFLLQVATPKFKFMEVFASCIVGAGDPDNPSRVWFSWQGGPQIFSTYGKVYGNYIDVNPEDGQIITGLKVADGRLYVGKNNSLYFIDYTQNANDPFSNPRKVHGQEGVQSHWSMSIIPKGLWYLSPRGPAICYGTYSEIDPAADIILNLFDAGDPDRFNVSSMAFAVSANYVDRQQVWMTIASSSTATLRDKFLVYDYERDQYWINEDSPSNVISMISDSNGNNRLFCGTYYGKIARKNIESDSNPYLSDSGFIPTQAVLPDLDFTSTADWKEGGYLEISGPRVVGTGGTPGKLYIDFYKNGSSNVAMTTSIDMTSINFRTGIPIQIPFLFKSLRIGIRHYLGNQAVSSFSTNAMELDSIRFEYTVTGLRR